MSVKFKILFFLFSIYFLSADKHPLLARGKCEKHTWRNDPDASMPGKCTGINPSTEYADLKDIQFRNAGDCRALCCNLDTRCTVWQFQNSTKTCFIQKRPMRKGPEGTDTILYCDPLPVHPWNGKYLGHRVKENSKFNCKWAYTIPKQCFAFGPERFKSSVDGSITMDVKAINKRMNDTECEEACCQDPQCNSYQEYPGRGCYYGTSNCKHEEIDGSYEGGRKCLPGFCAGREGNILTLPGQMEKLKEFVASLKKES